MASERQINAARTNGAKSRGPKTPEGKRRSVRNRTIHGLLARDIVLDGESRERFERLHHALVAELEPETTLEHALVEDITVCRWRIMRLRVIENAAVNLEMRNQPDTATEDRPARTTIAWGNLNSRSRLLDALNRHETRLDRQVSRCLTRLNELQTRRNLRKTKETDPAAQLPAPENREKI